MGDEAKGDRPAKLRRRSAYVWPGAIVAGTAALAIASGSAAMTGVWRTGYAAAALRISPNDAGALVKNIDNALGGEGGELIESGQVGRSALRSLEGSTINPGALRLLAIEKDWNGDKRQSWNLFKLSERLSRRDVGTQFVLLEKRVEQNDVPGTLVHYDRILRTSPRTREMLFGMFNAAAEDQGVAQEIAKLLRTDPPWLGAFLDWAAFQAPAVDNLGKVFLSQPAQSPTWSSERKRSLVVKLVSAAQNDAAFALYRKYTGSDGRLLIRNGDFKHVPKYPPIDWMFGSSPELEASLGDGAKNARYSASAGNGGVALTQLVSLPQGRYRFAVEMSHDVAEAVASPSWTISCFGQASQLAMRLDVGVTGNRTVVRGRDFTIPAGNCAYQWLRLELHATDNTAGQTGVVESVKIEAVPKA